VKFVIVIISLLILSGCLAPVEKDCGNECLEKAFLECKKESGIWNGENGNISVKILERNQNSCKVSVTVLGNALNISRKSMTCNVPLEKNKTFRITNCTGDLKKYFSDLE